MFYFLVALVMGLTVHEASHALIADRLGDPTARRLGRITLNPIAHLDQMGTLMMIFAAIAGIGIGWGKPVPVNPYNLRIGPKRGMALVGLAGPLANLTLATVVYLAVGSGLIPLKPGEPATEVMLDVVNAIVSVNVSLAFFNLIPVPPLDGFSVLLGLLPDPLAYRLVRLEQYGPVLLLLLVFVGQRFIGAFISFFAMPYFTVIQQLALLLRSL